MKRRFPKIGMHLLWMIALAAVWSCSDDIQKASPNEDVVRVEFSRCIGCLECIEDFQCPEGAFYEDQRTATVMIDADKCVQCMKCMDQFQCKEAAIVVGNDVIAPAKIQDLQAISDTTGQLRIQFTAPGDDGNTGHAFAYECAWKNQQNQPIIIDFTPPLPQEAGSQEAWLLEDLPQNALLTVSIQAVDEVANAATLAEQQVRICGVFVDSIAPAQIQDLAAHSEEDQIILHWTAPGDDGMEGSALRYEIRYATSTITEANWLVAEIVTQSLVPQASGTEETWIIQDLEIGQPFHFAIRAYDDEDNQAELSNVVTGEITGDVTTPSAIEDLRIVAASTNSLLLNWTAVGDNGDVGTAYAYQIKVSTDAITATNWSDLPEIEQSIVPQGAGNAESFLVGNLESLTTYFVAIKAIDEVGNISELSNVVQESTSEVPDDVPPAAITDLTATASATEILLEWTAPGDDGNEGTAVSYQLKYSTASITEENWVTAIGLTDVPSPQQAGSAQSYTCEGLSLGTVYYFAIKATDDAQNTSSLSNVVESSLLQDEVAPAAITNLSVIEGNAVNSSTIRIQWTAPGDDGNEGTVASYQIRYATSPINETSWNSALVFANPPAPYPAGNTQTCNVSGLDEGTKYYFAVKATDDNANQSAISNSPGGKIVYQIDSGPCNGCGRCLSACDEGAISYGGSSFTINPDLCVGCGDCVSRCPRNAIHLSVVAY